MIVLLIIIVTIVLCAQATIVQVVLHPLVAVVIKSIIVSLEMIQSKVANESPTLVNAPQHITLLRIHSISPAKT
jgi:hypothetical protein